MSLPDGMPLFYKYLHKEGYSAQLLYKYVQNGWLDRVANGVYKKNGKDLDPLLIVKSFQTQLGLPFFIGAQSALRLQSRTHFVKFSSPLYVFIPSHFRLNAWMKHLGALQFVKGPIFKDPVLGLIEWEAVKVRIAAPERAFLEMAALIPQEAGYSELVADLELAPNLRAGLLQALLESCESVKAKRIFLSAAERQNYRWFSKLELQKIDLGSGPRRVVKGGVFHRKYQIYLPEVNS